MKKLLVALVCLSACGSQPEPPQVLWEQAGAADYFNIALDSSGSIEKVMQIDASSVCGAQGKNGRPCRYRLPERVTGTTLLRLRACVKPATWTALTTGMSEQEFRLVANRFIRDGENVCSEWQYLKRVIGADGVVFERETELIR